VGIQLIIGLGKKALHLVLNSASFSSLRVLVRLEEEPPLAPGKERTPAWQGDPGADAQKLKFENNV
jgi:hypothetical protein